ncbi:MAG TPA: hypothetical protein VGT05_00415 [Patescibacteria group bacterium]|nr:hypothetical protein [Patescibacteria group bacterium]
MHEQQNVDYGLTARVAAKSLLSPRPTMSIAGMEAENGGLWIQEKILRAEIKGYTENLFSIYQEDTPNGMVKNVLANRLFARINDHLDYFYNPDWTVEQVGAWDRWVHGIAATWIPNEGNLSEEDRGVMGDLERTRRTLLKRGIDSSAHIQGVTPDYHFVDQVMETFRKHDSTASDQTLTLFMYIHRPFPLETSS